MSARKTIFFFLLALLIVPQAPAKNNKKKQLLPNYVLKAQTIAVMIFPDAGEPVTDPLANRNARDNVENAMRQWGRYRVLPDPLTADLIIAVRKGLASGQTVRNSPTDTEPIIYDGGTPSGVQLGRPPDVTMPGPSGPMERAPHTGTEMGASEDMLALFMGGVEYPLDAPAIWRYKGKNALNSPKVAAVEQFKDAVTESEQISQQKH